jgi:hypothetical protein
MFSFFKAWHARRRTQGGCVLLMRGERDEERNARRNRNNRELSFSRNFNSAVNSDESGAFPRFESRAGTKGKADASFSASSVLLPCHFSSDGITPRIYE